MASRKDHFSERLIFPCREAKNIGAEEHSNPVLRHPDNIGGFILVDHNASVPLVKALDLAFRKVRLLGLRVKELADWVGPFQAEVDYGVVNVTLALGSGGAGHDTNGRFVFCGTLKRFDLDVLPLGSGNGLVPEIDVIEMLAPGYRDRATC